MITKDLGFVLGAGIAIYSFVILLKFKTFKEV